MKEGTQIQNKINNQEQNIYIIKENIMKHVSSKEEFLVNNIQNNKQHYSHYTQHKKTTKFDLKEMKNANANTNAMQNT